MPERPGRHRPLRSAGTPSAPRRRCRGSSSRRDRTGGVDGAGPRDRSPRRPGRRAGGRHLRPAPTPRATRGLRSGRRRLDRPRAPVRSPRATASANAAWARCRAACLIVSGARVKSSGGSPPGASPRIVPARRDHSPTYQESGRLLPPAGEPALGLALGADPPVRARHSRAARDRIRRTADPRVSDRLRSASRRRMAACRLLNGWSSSGRLDGVRGAMGRSTARAAKCSRSDRLDGRGRRRSILGALDSRDDRRSSAGPDLDGPIRRARPPPGRLRERAGPVVDTVIRAGDTAPLHTHLVPHLLIVSSGSQFVRRDVTGEVLVGHARLRPRLHHPGVCLERRHRPAHAREPRSGRHRRDRHRTQGLTSALAGR